MEEIKTTYQGFAEIARIIREGKMGQLHIGDTISTRHTLRDWLLWRIIGINADTALDGTPETVTVMLCNPPIWCSFDGGRKGFPFGCNEWEPSDMRARLQGDVLDGFDAEDRAVIVPVRKATYGACWTATRNAAQQCPDKVKVENPLGFQVGLWADRGRSN